MTRFVHCRGCGAQIHETATACPKCGAPQAAVASPAAAAVPAHTPAGSSAPITSYDQVPWYRKRWFCVLLLFVFVPALVVIAFTGDVYYVTAIPSVLRTQDVVVIAIAAFVLTSLATLYPARRAAKVNPASALRYE